ncbi:MAG: FAD-binding oxidoreductase [Beijerinckiaceae bacterium]|nr:FAD-binding oxidoreductase [Beijerinckiaceae bacterium]
MDITALATTPYWWDAAPREAEQAVALPAKADVVIIGGGYAGLSAALTLARAGRSVVVCEAGPPGFGASSRSGGMIGHGHRLSYSALVAKYGAAKAKALILEGMASLDFAKALVADEEIDAKLKPVGRLRGAWTTADYDTMGREADKLRRDVGLPVDVIEKSDMRREISADCYQGGLIFHSHAGLHPALFQQGLLATARKAGVLVAGYTPVTRVARNGRGFDVETSRGAIVAETVLVTTNGYSGKPVKRLAKRLVPFPSFLIATEEIGENRVSDLIPNGRMIVETREKHLYYRPSPDGKRIILGGRAALHPIPLDEAAMRLEKELKAIFPALKGTAVSHVWTGNIAMTRSDLPGIGQRDGLWYALGCNGSGVALMPYLGHKLALKVLGDKGGATAFDDIPFTALPFYDGRPWFLPLMTHWFRLRDRLHGNTVD